MTLKYAEVRFHHTPKTQNVRFRTEMPHFLKKWIKRFTTSKKLAKLIFLKFSFLELLNFG